jgi:hypothetical protein
MSKKTRTAEDADVLAATLEEGDTTLNALRVKTGLDETRVIRATNLLKAQRRLENAANGLLHLVEPPIEQPPCGQDGMPDQPQADQVAVTAQEPTAVPAGDTAHAERLQQERQEIADAVLTALAAEPLTHQQTWRAVNDKLGREINAGTFANVMYVLTINGRVRHARHARYALVEEKVSIPEQPESDQATTEAQDAPEAIAALKAGDLTLALARVMNTLPLEQCQFLIAVATGQPVVKNAATRTALVNRKLVQPGDNTRPSWWDHIELTEKGAQLAAALLKHGAPSPMPSRLELFLADPVDQLHRRSFTFTDEEMATLLEMERTGKNRKTMLEAIEREIHRRSEWAKKHELVLDDPQGQVIPAITVPTPETTSVPVESPAPAQTLVGAAAAMAAPAPTPAEPSSNGDALKAENALLRAKLEAALEGQRRERAKRQRALLALKTLKHTPQGEALGASILREQIHSARHAFDRTGNPILKVYLPIDQLANRAVDMLLELERKHQTALETIDRLRVEARKAAAQPAEQAGSHG